ncbi:MAG: ribosome silencing factor [Clostridia bacterium]|nr:ribosome silencing factor [Oscillospiraceae bacterium]MBR4892375.1 ribosome silencing factor [Clostridia bacterium]
MDALKKAKKIVELADLKKAHDIDLIKIEGVSSITDYFVICTANSELQVKAVADEIEFKLKEEGIVPTHIEGYQTAGWVLLDYNDVVCHIFNKESRAFYSLERLWQDAERIDISDIITE